MYSASSSVKSEDVDSEENRQMLVHNNEGKLSSKKIIPDISSELLAAAVIKHDLPVSFVEYDGIRAWLKYTYPDVPCISKNTLMSEITKIHAVEKEKIKSVFVNLQNRICVTCDVWTGPTNEKYICFSGQFVDENWKLNSKILSFEAMPYQLSKIEMSSKIFKILHEWGVSSRVFSLTMDDVSSANRPQGGLKDILNNYGSRLLCGGEFFHNGCLANVLDTIVQEGLKAIDCVLLKIRESLDFVKSSEERENMFKRYIGRYREIDTKFCLRSDEPTRWDSTYLMVCSAIKYRKAFPHLEIFDEEYKFCPSNEEWERAEKICELLEPFYDTANLISGSIHPTSNLYFMQVWKIGVTLLETLSSEDAVISDTCRSMKEKFDVYWSQYSMNLACGAILDPRIKLAMLDFFYSKIETDPIKCQEMISLVKKKLNMLFEHYANIGTHPSSSKPQSSSIKHSPMQRKNGVAIKGKGKRIFDEITAYESQTVSGAGKSELVRYLEDPKLQFSDYKDLDVLEFWKKHTDRYPILALMARDVLAIPITTGASQSTFSIGANVCNKYRGCALPKTVQTLICTRNWLHGYVIDNEESAGNEATLSA